MAPLTFAEAVRSVRLAHGISLREFSIGLGLNEDPSLVLKWERGRNKGICSRAVLRAMWEADPTFARIAQEIWRLTT